jgi:hypothetical protein
MSVEVARTAEHIDNLPAPEDWSVGALFLVL